MIVVRWSLHRAVVKGVEGTMEKVSRQKVDDDHEQMAPENNEESDMVAGTERLCGDNRKRGKQRMIVAMEREKTLEENLCRE